MESKERHSIEFKALQDEMLENSRKIYQIITSTIVLCAGLIGYCFSPGHFLISWTRPFALLSPFLILVPAMILIQSNQHATVRIATYLMIVFEEYEDQELPGWQTAMHWCRAGNGPERDMQPEKRTGNELWFLLKQWIGELTLLVDPGTSHGRHFHKGLRGILCGIAIVSTLGSVVAWGWLGWLQLSKQTWHSKYWWTTPSSWRWLSVTAAIIACYVLCLLLGWWLFLLAYRDMREGWEYNRFAEWQKHWQGWAQNNVKHQTFVKRLLGSTPDRSLRNPSSQKPVK